MCKTMFVKRFSYVFFWLESNVTLTVFNVYKKKLMQHYNQTLFQQKSNVQLTLEKHNCITWECDYGVTPRNQYVAPVTFCAKVF